MKIAIVTTYPPGKGSLNEYGFHLVKHLSNKPEIEEIILLTDQLPDGQVYTPTSEGCPIILRETWAFNSLLNTVSLLRAIKEIQPDIVLFNIQFLTFGDKKIPAALGLLAPLCLKITKSKSMVLLHNIMEEVDLKKAGFSQNRIVTGIYQAIGTLLTKFILKADNVAVTIAKYVTTLSKKYGTKNISLIPHGSFDVPPMPAFTLPAGPYKVMTFGKFGTYKKVEVLIEAVELIRKRSAIDIEIVVAGTDSPNTPGYLNSIAEKFSSVKQLVFTGYVPEEKVEQIFTESAVSVFPYSSTTGSSGVLHQAGSYGVAAVLPRIGDLAELVSEEGYTGEFFEPENAHSLANAIEKVLTNEEYRIHLGKTNYLAAASLSLEDIADWYVTHFENLLGKTKKIRTKKSTEIQANWQVITSSKSA